MNDSVKNKINDAVRILNQHYSKIYFLKNPELDVKFILTFYAESSFNFTYLSGEYLCTSIIEYRSVENLKPKQIAEYLLRIIKPQLTTKSNLVRLIYEGETNVQKSL